MGFKDDFVGAKLLIKIAAVVVVVAQLFNWISFCTSSWIKISNGRYGLWRKSREETKTPDIDVSSTLDGTDSDYFATTQAFAIFGFVGLNVGCLLLALFIFWGSCKGKSETGLAAGISLIVSAVTWLIAVIVLAAKTNDGFGFSFGLAICALILAGVAGVLILVGQCGGGSVGAK